MLMEKAYAKLYGAYDKIESGLTGEAIRDLTGAPYIDIYTKDGEEKVWDFLTKN